LTGETISHYKVLEKLGEGGMGVVYRAEDTKLERPVALKFLPTHLLGDGNVRKRFEREAKASAALSHANVCCVYEIDEADRKTFIAMELIEGESPNERIKQGLVKPEDVLSIAAQIAGGLEAAHKKGVVHRDIKPENIMLGDDGHVTIMDFGLAQLTQASRLTKANETMGTVFYMSPEHTEGADIDQRTDIWSLGVVIYEMVTGQHPFKGDYDKAVMYLILNEEPEPMTALRTGVPMELERITRKCIAKDAAARYQHADELLVDLRSFGQRLASGLKTKTPTLTATTAPATAARSSAKLDVAPARNTTPLLVVTALACLAAGFLAACMMVASGSRENQPVRKFSLEFDHLAPGAQISPDGRRIAYCSGPSMAERRLWVRDLDDWESRVLEGTERAGSFCWSPDGKWLAFMTATEIKRVPSQGGPVEILCKTEPRQGGSVDWAPDGNSVIFSAVAPAQIYQVSAAGGSPEVLISSETSTPGRSLSEASILSADSGRRALLFRIGTDIFVQDLETTERKLLTRGNNPTYSSTGHILFQRQGRTSTVSIVGSGGGALWALPFSVPDLKTSGEPFSVGSGAFPSVSNDGTLLSSLSSPASYSLVWRDRDGTNLDAVGNLQGNLESPFLQILDRREFGC